MVKEFLELEVKKRARKYKRWQLDSRVSETEVVGRCSQLGDDKMEGMTMGISD